MNMDMDTIKSLIQPAVIQEENGTRILKFERTDPDVIARSAHLSDTVRVFHLPLQSGGRRRYILYTPERDLALQAAVDLVTEAAKEV